jgi:lipoprotein-anchoring transpeptidase ErfK/SrfK
VGEECAGSDFGHTSVRKRLLRGAGRVSWLTQRVRGDTHEAGESSHNSCIFICLCLARRLQFSWALAVQGKGNTREDAMTARRHNTMAAMMAAVLSTQLMGQSANQSAETTAQAPATAVTQPAPATAAKRVIVVSLEDRKLALVEDGQVKKIYTVAVGKPSTPSPVGTFTIAHRVMNPTYAHDGRVVRPGPNNPVGTRWMGLSIPGYGIHGTNVPSSIGKAASHGCIRMAKKDLEELYPMVEVGDMVEMIGQRNQETAQLFGAGEKATQPASLTAVASVEQVPVTAPAAALQAKNSTAQPGAFTVAATATFSSLMFAGSL